jgi:hypothetical protein
MFYEITEKCLTEIFSDIALKCKASDASCSGSYNTAKVGEAPDAAD